MASEYIFVAVWTLEDGHSVRTLTDEGSYRRWKADPIHYTEKRLRRWNSPNRKNARLKRAEAFQIVPYMRSHSSNGDVPVGSVGHISG